MEALAEAKQKHPGGRPPGARNKRTKAVAELLDRLERRGEIVPAKWITALETIALDVKNPVPAVAAIRTLLLYRYGAPPMRVAHSHENTTIEKILEQIAKERRLRLQAAVETTAVEPAS